MWLHVPSTCCPSALVAEGSTSGSSEPPVEPPALWCTSSGKPSLRPASWPGWKRRPWRQLLSGTTCSPSTAARGVASWIASLAAHRAKTSASPASRPGSTESALGSSSSRFESPASARPRSSSGRTSGEQLALFPPSTPSSPGTATPEPSSAFELLTWVRPTSGDGSSCWPTAAVSDSRSSARGTTTTGVMHPGTSLTDAMRADAASERRRQGRTESDAQGQALADGAGSHGVGDAERAVAQLPRGPGVVRGSECSTGGAGHPAAGGEPRPAGADVAAQDGVGLANASGARLEGGERAGASREGAGAPRPAAQRGRPLEWPPGPGDVEGWARVASVAPHLVPAQPCFRRVAHELAGGVDPADAYWADRLRLLGNGVVPSQAAAAFAFLWQHLERRQS